MTTKTYTTTTLAKNIRAGDFLPGLDNGYVFEDPTPPTGSMSAWSDDYVEIGFHTAQGEEAYLICPVDMPITVQGRVSR